MLKVSEHIYSTLDRPAINAVAPGGIFWALADEKTVKPYITYVFTGGPQATKDHLRDHQVNIRIYANNLTEGATIAEVIQEELEAVRPWKDRGYVSDYADPETQEAYVGLTYEFKL